MNEEYITKNVSFRYDGLDLSLDLSQGLFSSFDVDSGTKLLLKTLAQTPSLDPKRGLDCGSGTGILALCVKKRYPQSHVTALDRDALAVEFTAHNARKNHLEITTLAGLLLEAPPGPYDLILSNLPAKAGNPVLQHFFQWAPHLLTPEGRVAVVIVHTLAQAAESWILEAGHTLLHKEKGAAHSVFHFRASAETPLIPHEVPAPPLARGTHASLWQKKPYSVETVWSLPNFDTLDFESQMLENAFKKASRWGGPSLLWNPLQGHLPSALTQEGLAHDWHLAGRDLLSLRISQKNTLAQKPLSKPTQVTLHHVCGLEDLLPACQETFPWIYVRAEAIPLVPYETSFWTSVSALLAPKGQLWISGASSLLHRIELKKPKGWVLTYDKRLKGARLLAFLKP